MPEATYMSTQDLHMDKNKDTQALCTHEVNHALEHTHIDANAHLDDYSWPPGAILKLFSHDLPKGIEGVR